LEQWAGAGFLECVSSGFLVCFPGSDFCQRRCDLFSADPLAASHCLLEDLSREVEGGVSSSYVPGVVDLPENRGGHLVLGELDYGLHGFLFLPMRPEAWSHR
jgi:hypothetical protein